ncbi:MAG TPA: ATP-binding protein [Gaiellaceae bacterium]|nr:ATP-binding protein [Gaiellaceae bacterium]
MAAPPELDRRRQIERWVARVRVGGVAFAVVEIAFLTKSFPDGYETAAWALTGAFAAGALVLFALARSAPAAYLPAVGFGALCFDTAVISAYAVVFSYEYGNQTRWALVFVVAEAALRYGLLGGVALPLALVPVWWFVERWRVDHFAPPGPGFLWDRVTFPSGVLLLTGLIVGWLVRRLDAEVRTGAERAAEAERLRDELGRRVDVLEAASRSARALGSSLRMEDAFAAFIREVQALVPFDRTAIVLVEGESARTIATAGRGAGTVFPPGSSGPLHGSVLDRVTGGEIVVRGDLSEQRYEEDQHLLELGLRSELLAPLVVGARPIGMISLSRSEPDAFTPEEVDLVALLGRLVATTIQNIRAYEAERHTVEELRRLSALRADFVSLVSHELRSPMAAVIGAARTLQDRWRQLTPDQRDAFLALIADETNRLAALIGDVLDTSRIEAGTFSFSFTDVDLVRLVEDAVGTAAIGQDEVRVTAELPDALPPVRGDRERLRQVLANLIDNAIKYSPAGEEVAVTALREDGVVRIAVRDRGPGIPSDQQRVIFEKFGRADVVGAKPGTGLGLFIARSIAEAHGGSLHVTSVPDAGATFVLTLPLG